MNSEAIRNECNSVNQKLMAAPALLAPNGMAPVIAMLGEIAAQLSEAQFPLRDRFALAALGGYISCDESGCTFWGTGKSMAEVSTNAYAWADAMLRARGQ
jgi:hypothetical protein